MQDYDLCVHWAKLCDDKAVSLAPPLEQGGKGGSWHQDCPLRKDNTSFDERPALCKVSGLKQRADGCNEHEMACGGGYCVDHKYVCDGKDVREDFARLDVGHWHWQVSQNCPKPRDGNAPAADEAPEMCGEALARGEDCSNS